MEAAVRFTLTPDVNECLKNNGGCHSKRKCMNTVGSMKCGDCAAGYVNDGAKGCKGSGAKIVQVIYKSGKNSQSQAYRNKEIIKGTLKVVPGVQYSVKAEVLRNDMGGSSEKLATVTLDGKHMLPSAGCNPPGSDYACDFWKCPVVSAAQVMSKTGSIAVAYDVKETSYDCDCDTKSWQCSSELAKVKGRTPMEAAVRFTLTPMPDVNKCLKNNGGCHSKRKCMNTGGSMKCGDCAAGYVNDGAKGCKKKKRPRR